MVGFSSERKVKYFIRKYDQRFYLCLVLFTLRSLNRLIYERSDTSFIFKEYSQRN